MSVMLTVKDRGGTVKRLAIVALLAGVVALLREGLCVWTSPGLWEGPGGDGRTFPVETLEATFGRHYVELVYGRRSL